jgi:PAS domain S-box-containing protein
VLLKGPFKVACTFLAFSAAWILLTDLLFETYFNASLGWHISKGLFYVLTSSLILFWLSRRLVIDAQRWERTLVEIFEQTAFGVCFTDGSGRIIDCNHAYSKFMGYEVAEMVGRNFYDLVDPTHVQEAKENFKALFEQKTSRSYVRKRKFIDRNGAVIWARVVGSRIDPGGKEAPFLVALLQDITSEVATQEALEFQEAQLREMLDVVQESETRFRGLAECSMTGIAVASWNGQILDANGEFLRMLGYTREELESGILNWLEITPPEYHESKFAALKELKAAHYFPPYDEECIAKDGTRIPILISGRWISEDLKGCVKFVVSITDLRSARRAEAQLSRLALAVESAYESIVITELDGSIVYVNPAFEVMTGYKRGEVIGKSPQILSTGRTSQGEYDDIWREIRAGRTWSGRFWNRRKDGVEYLEDATISPVRDDHGRVINYLAVKRDITREHLLENRLRQTQKLEALGQLTGGVAHDLNNVLQVVQSCAELGLRRTTDAAYAYGKMCDILTASKRGAGIIAQLLAFTRRQGAPLKQTDLNEVISETGTMLKRLLPDNVELRMELGNDLLRIQADPARLSQVLLNLAVNARDAMPEGGLLSIRTSKWTDSSGSKSWLRLTVEDSGIGMSADTKAQMFEPFFTTKEAGRGTGLGLATVKEIVEQAGAEITVESEPGKGARFHIDFPEATRTLETAAENERVSTERPVSGRVMVCEDDAAVRTAICDYLEAVGVEVIGCRDANEAIAEAAKEMPDVLISDVIMPGRSGLQLVEELRLQRKELKVLLMTGHTEREILSAAEARSNVSVLLKPFSTVSLMRHLRELERDFNSINTA